MEEAEFNSKLSRELYALGFITASWAVRDLPPNCARLPEAGPRAAAADAIRDELGTRSPRGDDGHRVRGAAALVRAWGRRVEGVPWGEDGDRAAAALEMLTAPSHLRCGDCAAAILERGAGARCEPCEDEAATIAASKAARAAEAATNTTETE